MLCDDCAIRPIHPGEILREDYMPRFGLSVRRLARRLRLPLGHISLVLAGKRAITVDLALRLGRLFGVEPELWLVLQTDYDLSRAYMRGEAQVTDAVQPLRRPRRRSRARGR